MPEVPITVGHDSVRLHYLQDGEGPAVLLLHGLGGFAESWRHCMPALSRHFTVYALDLPGFGHSAKPRVNYRLAFFARAVDGFLEAEKIGRASLVGHSLGAAVAAAFAVAFPWKLERMVLVSPIVPGARGFRPGWPYRVLAIPGLGELAAGLAWKGILRYFLRRCFASVEPEELEYLLGMGYDVRTSADRRRAYLATLREVRRDLRQNEAFYRDHLGRLPADVLFVTGEADPVVPRGHVRAATALFRRATTVSLPGCGHFPQIEKAEEFSDHLTSFLAPPR